MNHLAKPMPLKVVALALAIAALSTLTSERQVRAQGLAAARTLDCGPGSVDPGDVVDLNVGNSNREKMRPATLLLRLVDEIGRPLAEQQVVMAPGQSKRLRLQVDDASRGALVRGEVLRLAGPKRFRVFGTLQLQKPGLGMSAVQCEPPVVPTTAGKSPA